MLINATSDFAEPLSEEEEEEGFNEEPSDSESVEDAESDDDFDVKPTRRQLKPRPRQKSKG